MRFTDLHVKTKMKSVNTVMFTEFMS